MEAISTVLLMIIDDFSMLKLPQNAAPPGGTASKYAAPSLRKVIGSATSRRTVAQRTSDAATIATLAPTELCRHQPNCHRRLCRPRPSPRNLSQLPSPLAHPGTLSPTDWSIVDTAPERETIFLLFTPPEEPQKVAMLAARSGRLHTDSFEKSGSRRSANAANASRASGVLSRSANTPLSRPICEAIFSKSRIRAFV
jgi:hypothetical protein